MRPCFLSSIYIEEDGVAFGGGENFVHVFRIPIPTDFFFIDGISVYSRHDSPVIAT